MNNAIKNSAIFCLILSIILLINLSVIHVFKDEEYAKNSLNRRGLYELQSTPRGQIAAGGLVLAESKMGEDEYYYRNYPNNVTPYGPTLGYISDMYGASGLESSYNDILNGTDPSLFASRWIDTITGKEKVGASLKLTLEPAVQEVAYNGLAQRGYEGAVVAMNPKTGEILAMASTPSYDPSLIADPAQADQAWATITSQEGSPMLNHATQETLPPGSTFKVITTAAALEDGYTPDTKVTGARQITLPNTNTTLENYGGKTCGGGEETTLNNAFAQSCNTAFVEMGIDVGADNLTEAAKKFGVGETYDLGLPMSPGALGDLSDAAARGQSSIGQRDVSMSVLQNAVVAATVANGGVRMEPHIVSEVLGRDLRSLKKTKPKELNKAVDAQTAATLTELMKASEQHSGGYSNIASKTGTAEHGEDSRNSNPHAWYIAFGPSEDADVAVAVVVKNGGDRGQDATGGSVAAPIGREVIDAALRSAR